VTYLADANVLSEPTKSSPDSRVVEWLRRNERETAVDLIILGEVRFGILLLPKGRRRAGLERWRRRTPSSPWKLPTSPARDVSKV
jgi:predicted nucleic acid-binding protein